MLFQPREPPVRSHQAGSTRRDLTYPPRLTAAVLPPGGKDCDFVRSGVPKVGSATCGPGRMRWFQRTVPDLTGRWIPTASHLQGDGALQPGAGGPLPGHLHVISTGSTADLHTGLVGCGDIDDGGVGQGSHDPVGIAAVGLVHPGGLGSDPVQRTEYSPRVTPRPGTSSCTDGRQGMLLTTTSTLQDRHIDDYKGVVSGEAILGANAFRDMFAGIRDIVGGRSAAYERELQKAKDLAISEMVERARDTGANAVIGIDLDYETVGQMARCSW